MNILRIPTLLQGSREIIVPALPRPTLRQIQEDFPFVKDILSDDSPQGPLTVRLFSLFDGQNDEEMSGAQYEFLLRPHRGKLLGFQHAAWLARNRKHFPELEKLLLQVSVDFAGIRLSAFGEPRVLYLASGWQIRLSRADEDVDQDNLVAAAT
ncbi:MAG: hypothetical protein Q8P45_02725 [Candidatus Harrisonbacteria bacterium]|nr:hypothetical protein [Candidatus Harrisonbacteria bacterium]